MRVKKNLNYYRRKTAYIGLGSNMGDRLNHLAYAINALQTHPSIQQVTLSPVYATQPLGGPPQAPFLNAVAKILTSLSGPRLLQALLEIEKTCGRQRRIKWGPRTLDLDILLIGKKIYRNKNLSVPHPHLHKRNFVLSPLLDLSPGLIHPVLKRRLAVLKDQLTLEDQRVTIWGQWKNKRFYPSKTRKKRRSRSPH